MNKFSRFLLLFIEIIILGLCLYGFYYMYEVQKVRNYIVLISFGVLFILFFIMFLRTFFTKPFVSELVMDDGNSRITFSKEAIENSILYSLSDMPLCRNAKVSVTFKEGTDKVYVTYEQELMDFSNAIELENTIKDRINNSVHEVTGEYPKKIDIKFNESKEQEKDLKKDIEI